MKVWKGLAVSATAALTVLAAGAASASAAPSFVHRSNHWAGYVAVPKTGGIARNFNDAQATFTVPALNCSATPNSQVYQLAGIGGWNQIPFQAAGIVEQCSGGSANYYGAIWYYLGYPYYTEYPAQEVLSGVSAGDTVKVSAFYNATLNQVNFTVADVTTGTYYQQPTTNINYGSYPSAEVLSYGNIASQGTADFVQVRFTQAQVIDTSQHYRQGLQSTAFKTLEFAQKGPITGQIDIQPGPLTTTGSGKLSSSAFTNTWLRPN